MYIIIIGCGRLGSNLARDLSDEGHDVAVIDRDASRLNALGSGFNGTLLQGVEYDYDVLQQAGISFAQVFLAMTPDDNINIAGAQIARDIFKVPRVIARISDPQKEFIYKRLNLETICPTQTGAYVVRSRVLEAGTNIIATVEPEYELLEIISGASAKRTVGWFEQRFQCRISGIVRDKKTHLAQPEELILQGDRLVCLVSATDRSRLITSVTGEAV